MMLSSLLCIAMSSISPAFGSSITSAVSPVVTLPYGSFQGSTTGNISSFLGMPFAQAPLDNLRFAPPQAPLAFGGVRQAVSYGAACLQQANTPPPNLPFNLSSSTLTNVSEDCLFINILKPESAQEGDNLPVLLWIFGGAFEEGDSSSNPGNDIVERSLVLGQPIIFVSFNYRLNAFGFLASEEVQQAGLTNIGLRDQRFALKWVNQHISLFGGDPSKVTIWGESAGSFSVGFQIILNDGETEGLFRAAVMESGSAYALRNVSAGQQYYDLVVQSTGCSQQADTLDCLRRAPAEQIIAAVNMTPNSNGYTAHNLAWQPRLDGDIFVRNPQRSMMMGLYAKVPIISGDCDDEGTSFSLGNTNITTDEEFLSYLSSNYIPDASWDEILAVGTAYPDDPALGAPFDTGDANQLTPQFKRIAAFTTDWQFQAPRRLTLSTMSQTQNAWSYLYRRGKSTPYLGARHGSDIPEFFSNGDFIGMDALINFATKLDPNAAVGLAPNISYLSGVHWAKWRSNIIAPPLLTFQDPAPAINFTTDTFRSRPIALLEALSLQMP
ncbi:sterol esterase [Wolfiporia cocos MD-104 SS10]|uniref:Carboxylic ester hydrolase n=1 Tax=Wolfiporia cocos (strain MD-104) TaxID=742152 RepID=A0A2H3JBW6_WOLCO|nr:sterol esterase [Wolfiporia cocos MD-104 SS10]